MLQSEYIILLNLLEESFNPPLEELDLLLHKSQILHSSTLEYE